VPNAAQSAVAGRLGDAWKIRLQAVPEDGKANKALVAFLAETLQLPRSAVTLVSGGASREKRVRVEGLAIGAVESTLAALSAN
jgi:uncharacterized protein (TIGR00251 family)